MNCRSVLVAISLCVLALFTGCDQVTQPLAPASAYVPPSDSTVTKKIFIEDYTGHTCGNCPKAVDTINSIAAMFPDRVISVGIHSGFYSTLSPPTYTYNFVVSDPTTPGYNELDNFFQISINGNPNGMVNRKMFDQSLQTHVLGTQDWRSYAAIVASEPAQVKIELSTVTDTVADQITATIETTFIDTLTGTYKLAVMLVEDSVIKPQKDYRISPNDNLTYAHRHVLRGYFFGAFGEQVGTVDPTLNSSDTKSYPISIPANIISIKKCAVIAYVYDAATYEVLQAEEHKLYE